MEKCRWSSGQHVCFSYRHSRLLKVLALVRVFEKPSLVEVGLRHEHHNKIWKPLYNQRYGLPWHPKSWLKSLSKKKVKSEHGIKTATCQGIMWKSLRGENRTFAECLTTVSQVKIQWFLCWSQLCCYKSTDFFCATLDLQCCNQPYGLVGSIAAKELYFITQAHPGDFSLCCHTASGLSSESKARRFSTSNSCFF